MAEENYMNQGPAVSPQGEVKAEQNKRQQTGSGSSGPGGNVQSSGTSKRTKIARRAAGASGQIWDEASRGRPDVKDKILTNTFERIPPRLC